MDAQQIPAIYNAGTLENFRGEMDEEPELIKEVITNIKEAAEIVLNRCRGHNHANAYCKLDHFHPFATPSNYVAKGQPADLDLGMNQTSLFNELSAKIN